MALYRRRRKDKESAEEDGTREEDSGPEKTGTTGGEPQEGVQKVA